MVQGGIDAPNAAGRVLTVDDKKAGVGSLRADASAWCGEGGQEWENTPRVARRLRTIKI